MNGAPVVNRSIELVAMDRFESPQPQTLTRRTRQA